MESLSLRELIFEQARLLGDLSSILFAPRRSAMCTSGRRRQGLL